MKEYFLIGECLEVNTNRGKFKFSEGDFYLVAPVGEDGYMAILPSEEIGNRAKYKPSKDAVDAYFEFNGKPVRHTCVSMIELPEEGEKPFAKAISVLYQSDKIHGGGDGNECQYRHLFGKTVYLWVIDRNSRYIISGRNLVVTERGIEH
jgi:hypothetical protein